MGDRNLAHALYLPPLSRANADAADVTARVMSHLKRIWEPYGYVHVLVLEDNTWP